MAKLGEIYLKKEYGQHFLRWQSVADRMMREVSFNPILSILEIGCGDGFLTKTIIQHPFERLWVFEIDSAWATEVRHSIIDERVTIFEQDILAVDFARFEQYKPWIFLSNLPYQITFLILHRLQQYRHLFAEGVVMVQDEVAEKILKKAGRGYGYTSLFFQYHFTWKKLDRVPPEAFYPPPTVYSRLLYFKPKLNMVPIIHEDDFWKFIKRCFRQPRRTLKNNLMQAAYDVRLVPQHYLSLRAQQMTFEDFLIIWSALHVASK